jgi:hypothetical protein
MKEDDYKPFRDAKADLKDYHLSCHAKRTFSGPEEFCSGGTPKSGRKHQM